MKIVSWNVNGIRSVHRKNFAKWFEEEKADIVCLQEIKINEQAIQKDETFYHPSRYHSHWHFAKKPGYSGLVIYSKKDPEAVRSGLGLPEFDNEGRWLEADYKNLTLITSYFPNSQREGVRLPYKLAFLNAAEKRLEQLRKKGRQVVICGDLNIAHTEIDLKNPKTNTKNAGFLPEERAWMEKMIVKRGWIDTFRKFEKGGGHYTWWSYRPGIRERNIGWRLDYFLANPESDDLIKKMIHLPEVVGSDHCPIRLTLKS
ncbi:exodeoxyribonuclease III [Pseudobdellovibrio exovorus]|uniref:Endonuclease/exonuclease/phosphatase domain-containing protein n=1 Tax=Pseudobdellovibrio exovorus JSS TaxID=1184267 RepID=M4V867_9BACT|nr:exodeoxyribonuclease III [Pseudobdellovibrio exovorus]AGH95408.1 hypothetical protein A11Q_1192 [Pseudobdellovibrio exovorus JSS]